MFVRRTYFGQFDETIIRFLIELLVRRTWFKQFDELCFVLNWLIMGCKLRPELVAEAQQTAWLQNVGKVRSSQYTLIIPHRLFQLIIISFCVPETRLRLPQANKMVSSLRSEWSIDTVIPFSSFFSQINQCFILYLLTSRWY